MAFGPGRYDKETTQVREQTKAQGVVVIVFGGEYGDGFSAQLPLALTLTLPRVLRQVADDIEHTHRRGQL